MKTKIMTIEQAVQKVEEGGSLEGVILEDVTKRQVSARDALILARAGIVLPEQNIYYNDDDIAYDEEIDELTIADGIIKMTWEEKAKLFEQSNAKKEVQKEVLLKVEIQNQEVRDWLQKNTGKLSKTLGNLIEELYNTQNIIKE